MFVKLCFTLLTAQFVFTENQMIGGLFYEDEARDLNAALEISARNNNFTVSVKMVSERGNMIEISEHVCALAEEGVIGIVDGTGGRASEIVQTICDMLELPHVVIQNNDFISKDWYILNMYPSPIAYNMVLDNLVAAKGWNNFTVLYVKGFSVSRVSNMIQIGDSGDHYVISMRELSGNDYRNVLVNAKQAGYYNFIVDCPSSHLDRVLRHAQQVGLMSEKHSYIFISPDLFTLDLSRYRYSGVNMTGLRLVHLADNEMLWNFTAQFNQETGLELEPEQLKTKVLLIHDAVVVFRKAVKKVSPVNPEIPIEGQSLNCESASPWLHGSSLLNFMKTNKVEEGLTRTLAFDGIGQRNEVVFDILELTAAGNQTIGTWSLDHMSLFRPIVPVVELGTESIMKNKTFKVLISLTPPFGYLKMSAFTLEGNERYEGFAVAVIEKLADLLGFNYEFELETDYGTFDDKTKKWTGMALKLREEKADFAICDLTITSERQSGIDFSTPFMSLGIGILYKEPSKQPPAMFSFMAVFSKEVWYYMLFVQLGIGVLMIFVGRISHKEWQNPVPCIEQPEELSNQFSFANSVWLIIGSVMQQGSEIAPIALAPRLITSVWWFFTMVIVASYVGTLVAFLTIEKNVLPFKNVQELHDLKGIEYGAKRKGSTIQFFKESNEQMFQDMYTKMSSNNWLVENNDEGVAIAETRSYALFMESTSIEYYKERHCDLLQVGGLLDFKNYGIGMKKNSPYKSLIDDALLNIKENGELSKIKDIWWKEKRGGGKCGESKNEEAKELGMKNMVGSFVVLGAGCGIGILISIIDMLWGVFKKSVKYKTTYKYELVEELKFALKFSGDIKPVKRPTSTDEGSAEALADMDEEAKDEPGSLKSARTERSVRSARSTSTFRSHHSHSSRHSIHGLSIAFAKRREYS